MKARNLFTTDARPDRFLPALGQRLRSGRNDSVRIDVDLTAVDMDYLLNIFSSCLL